MTAAGGAGGAGRTRWVAAATAVAILVLGVLVSGEFPARNGHYGAWSVVPAVAALVLAFTLREVVSALFVGIALGGVISGKLNIVQEFLLPSIGTADYAPLTRGLVAALPFVDDFLPARTLTNLGELAVHLNTLATRAPSRR